MALQTATLSTSCAPGRRLCVLHDGDDHWHERLLLWPGSPTASGVLTADNDLYVGELQGVDGPKKIQLVGLDGRLPRVSAGLRVSLTAPIGDNVLKQNVVRGQDAAEEFSNDFDVPKPLVIQAYNWSGAAVDVAAIQKRRAAVPGCILPFSVGLPFGPTDLAAGAMGVGKGEAPLADTADFQGPGPPVGRMWVTSEPGDKYALGDVVTLTSGPAVCDNKGVLLHSIGGLTGWFDRGLELSTGIAPQLTRHVATKMKDEAELHKQRNKARESRDPPSRSKGSGKGEVAKK